MKEKSVKIFFRNNIFFRFGKPRVIINNGGSYFYNYLFRVLLEKYGVNIGWKYLTILYQARMLRSPIVRSSIFCQNT